MLLPGPEAQQLATYIGWLMHRTLGGIMAGGLFVVPGIIAIMALSYVYAAYGNVPVIVALFFGLKAAVLAIVLEAVFRIGKRSLKNNAMRLLAAAAFVGIFFFNVPFPIIILGAALIGFLGAWSGAPAFQIKSGHGDGKKRARWSIACSATSCRSTRDRPSCGRCGRRAYGWRCGSFRSLRSAGQPGQRQRLQRDRDLLQQDGDGHLRRRLCGARLRRPAGRRELRLAQAGRDARWPRHGGDDSRPADHGAAIRGLHGRVSGPGRSFAHARGNAGRLARDVGDIHPMLSLDISGAPFIEVLRDNKALNGALSAITAAVVGVVLNLAIWFALHTVFREVRPVHGYGMSFDMPLHRQRRPVGARAFSSGDGCDFPLQGRNDPNAAGVFGRGYPSPLAWASCMNRHDKNGYVPAPTIALEQERAITCSKETNYERG